MGGHTVGPTESGGHRVSNLEEIKWKSTLFFGGKPNLPKDVACVDLSMLRIGLYPTQDTPLTYRRSYGCPRGQPTQLSSNPAWPDFSHFPCARACGLGCLTNSFARISAWPCLPRLTRNPSQQVTTAPRIPGHQHPTPKQQLSSDYNFLCL